MSLRGKTQQARDTLTDVAGGGGRMGLARVVGKVDDIDDVNTWARNKRNMHIHSHNTRATRSHPIDTFLRRAEHSRMPRGRAVQDRPAGHLHMYVLCDVYVCVCACACRHGYRTFTIRILKC